MQRLNKNNPLETPRPTAYIWDRNLLLGFLLVLAGAFILLNREADGFLPDARLYPYVMTIAGLLIVGLSIIRVAIGHEPRIDAQNGKEAADAGESIKSLYQKIIGYLLLITAFYLAIGLLGFRVAAGLFVLGFIKSYGHTWLNTLLYVIAGLLMVEVLTRILQLQLPSGVISVWVTGWLH